jgi:hypothetical protein
MRPEIADVADLGVGAVQNRCADRIGVARLARMQAGGTDLRPLWQTLITKLIDGTLQAGEGLDLALIAQLLGDKPCWRWRRQPTWAAIRRSSFCWSIPASN